jgi:rare lipoprotein A
MRQTRSRLTSVEGTFDLRGRLFAGHSCSKLGATLKYSHAFRKHLFVRCAMLTAFSCMLVGMLDVRPSSAHPHHAQLGRSTHFKHLHDVVPPRSQHILQDTEANSPPLAGIIQRLMSGIASVYSGGRTANGEHMNAAAMTAAHRTLPFGTHVNVLNNRNGRSVVVRINDRGPFVRGRVIDLSPAAARAIGVTGIASVSLTVASEN